MGRTLAVGDIHGQYDALIQTLERSQYKPQEDTLIVLGDIVDGGKKSYGVVDYLTTVPQKLIYIVGNHDQWFIDFIEYGIKEPAWTSQGGNRTLSSYRKAFKGRFMIPTRHRQLLLLDRRYYYVLNNKLFVHGGIDDSLPLEKQPQEVLLWDRDMIQTSVERNIGTFDTIYCGHTSTTALMGHTLPIQNHNVVVLDTGAGWPGGKLTIMDTDSQEFWQSDEIPQGR